MNISLLLKKIVAKPPVLVVVPIIYCFIVIFAKWHLNLPFAALWFFLGGLIGTYIITIAEHFFQTKQSPFRSEIFVIGLSVVAFYSVTSTREYIAIGIVLLTLLSIFLYQISEWKLRNNLDNWYSFFFVNVSPVVQKIGLIALGLVFFALSIAFVLS